MDFKINPNTRYFRIYSSLFPGTGKCVLEDWVPKERLEETINSYNTGDPYELISAEYIPQLEVRIKAYLFNKLGYEIHSK